MALKPYVYQGSISCGARLTEETRSPETARRRLFTARRPTSYAGW
jgi:hypothetical protein